MTLLGGAAAAWPFAARAQQQTMPVIGWLSAGSPHLYGGRLAAFRQGLSESGFAEGQNVAVEYRWAEGHLDLLPTLAASLVQRKVALIFTTGSTLPAVAAKAATSAIPIVFTGGEDPVRLGLVDSLNRPGGNATGVVNISATLDGKRVELLRELVPKAKTLIFLVNPNNPNTESATIVKETARALGQEYSTLSAGSRHDLDTAFSTMPQRQPSMLLVQSDGFFVSAARDQIVALATQYAVPASYPFREFTLAGGLMSYGADINEQHRQAAIYVAKILKGVKPGDLPVMQMTKFELVINLKTAKALGLTVPLIFQMTADEVIE
jgi:putative tryptophan/tyrosine transport system substrate-binding protein